MPSFRGVAGFFALLVVTLAWLNLCLWGFSLLMPGHPVAYFVVVGLACFGGGCLMAWLWNRLAWSHRRRRELLRQFGQDDRER